MLNKLEFDDEGHTMSFEYIKIDNKCFPYRLKDLDVFFTDISCLKIIETVLDGKGNINNFPGFIEDDRWISQQRLGLFPDVRYEAKFYAIDGGWYLMLWLTQPSGWYWVDEDGFGFTGDSPITLYSVINDTGSFTGRFELFSIGSERYCHGYDDICK